ncbi:hypothetical protein [Lysobacter gummosus]
MRLSKSSKQYLRRRVSLATTEGWGRKSPAFGRSTGIGNWE